MKSKNDVVQEKDDVGYDENRSELYYISKLIQHHFKNHIKSGKSKSNG
jgi:hypothetical protein